MLERVFPTHQVYVEPFFGGGAVFFGKTPSDKEVVNDLDSKLVADYRRVLDAPTDSSASPSAKTLAAQRRLLSSHPKSTAGQITESIIRRCNGFGGKYVMDASDIAKSSNPAQKTNHIQDYKKRLDHATILNQDYRKVIKAHDSAKTFFFLDPPYEMSKGVDYAAGSETFDFDELARVLQNLKGDFLITINDSPRIRDAFAGFQLYPYGVKGHHAKTSHIGQKDRKELLITNYTLPQTWRRGEGNPFFKNYLRAVKVRAELNGYDPDAVRMADDGIHKVEYKTPTGQTVRFGRVGYGDFILWTHLEREGRVPKGYALRKRAVFHKSHEAIKGDWKTNPYSPNNLALALLW